jgi:hypothetical protein
MRRRRWARFCASSGSGHVRQLDAVSSRMLTGLAGQTPVVAGICEQAIVDIDDSIVEVHGYAKQGAGFGYSGVRGLNSLLATVSTPRAAPVIVGQRLRRGAVGSPRGAKRMVADALAMVRRLQTSRLGGPVLVRADSAFFGCDLSRIPAACFRAAAYVQQRRHPVRRT